ncbi:MAG: hypothetical protein ABSE95_09470 [Thermodesulfobacteriota bacterium]|jgi:hypothetical protein
MKLLVTVLTLVLFLCNAHYAVAGNNLNIAASKLESAISNHLKGMGRDIKSVAQETEKLGASQESEIRKLLLGLCSNRPYVVDATFIDSVGLMKIIEPEQYKWYEGSDISKQAAIILMQKSKKPRMGKLFDSVEGIKSVDVEYPVFSVNKKFSGSISLLVRQDKFVRSVAAPVEKDLNVKCWVMQKDGIILYETDPTQIGLDLFNDPLYKDYPELLSLGKRMVKEKNGTGHYTFLIHGTDMVIKKEAAWKTIHFLNNDWIIVAYGEMK